MLQQLLQGTPVEDVGLVTTLHFQVASVLCPEVRIEQCVSINLTFSGAVRSNARACAIAERAQDLESLAAAADGFLQLGAKQAQVVHCAYDVLNKPAYYWAPCSNWLRIAKQVAEHVARRPARHGREVEGVAGGVGVSLLTGYGFEQCC